ncbi:hypothetical protein DL991_32725 [Amycolatopsis sp. WAC 01375]|uniref:hypothetical protein n=1 Tax=Amycolatopsis sp. WAC 01375 TaxID=2203194 RepID=UPI000F77D9EB|nr:hypothetical protein [Amycolatopsis sp. WAC 01375]RSM72963.1 hypothetical protein DL991_32725 [Amycolatopsis sp. WAC 01375]
MGSWGWTPWLLRVSAVVTTSCANRDSTKQVPLAHNTSEIFYPGEIENRAESAARIDGVPLPAKTLAELHDLAASCGIEVDLPRTGRGT